MEEPKLTKGLEKPRGSSLGDVVASLWQEIEEKGPESIIKSPRESRIAKSITPKELRDLSGLPFEIYLTEHRAGLTLVTGTRRAVLPESPETDLKDWHTQGRTLQEARFTLHNHPTSFIASPSAGDVSVSGRSVSEVDIVVAQDGLSVHKARSWGDALDADSLKRTIAWLRGGEHTTRYDLKKGFIDAWIPWGDPRVEIICSYINGDRPWKEYEQQVLEEKKVS